MAAPQRSALLSRLASSGPFGFGASSLGNLYREIDDARAVATVDAAWTAGVRYFDTAPFYGFGLSEWRLGEALSVRRREDFLLSTKVGRLLVPDDPAPERFGFRSPMPFSPVFDYSYDGVMRSISCSLQRLDVDRIDIVYMHDIGRATHADAHDGYFRQAVEGGFRALEDLRSQGVVSAIGLGVNEIEVCVESLPYADFDLFMIAGRYTLLDQESAGSFQQFRRRGIGIVAAGVFNSGILATGTGNGGGPVNYNYEEAPADIARRVAAIERICARFDVPLPAAALQFVTAHPAVTLAVVGTGNPMRIAQTVELARQPIPTAFWEMMRAEGLIASGTPMRSAE